MTGKRFKGFYVENKGWGISDTITNTDWLIETRGDLEEFLKVLNEQHEEIQCLRQFKRIKELYEENEQLKQENRKLKENLEHCANQFTNDGKNVLMSLR